jgi:hypothetical protein
MNKEIYTKAEMLVLDEFGWMRKRISWLEEIVALAQEHELLDLSNSNEWPQWEDWENKDLPKESDLMPLIRVASNLQRENEMLSEELEEFDNE